MEHGTGANRVGPQRQPCLQTACSDQSRLRRHVSGRSLARTSVLTLASIFAGGYAGAVQAQTAAATAQTAPSDTTSAAAENDLQLQDIVVTAQRRGQNLQEVPLAVTAFNNTALTQAGVANISEVGLLDPSLNINFGSGVVLPFIRGVGNPAGATIGNEASVPVYIDDVYYSRLSPIDLQLANVERVEVLKGPQGTLFGRNASGGAIQVFTRDPGSRPEFEVHGGYANYDTASGRIYASAPITNDIGANISVSGLRQGDGWGRNLVTGQDTYKDRFYNIRGKIVANVTPTTKVTLGGFYNYENNQQGVTNTFYKGTVNGTPALYGPVRPVFPPSFYDSVNTENSFVRHTGYGASLKIIQDVDFADVVSISAYRHAHDYFRVDGDSVSQNGLLHNLNGRDRELSEELQLKSKDKSSFDWILGGFYLNSREGYQPGEVTGDEINAGGLQALDFFSLQKIKSLAAYGQATFHVIPDNTNITLGLRYTSDKVRGIGTQVAVITPTFSVPAAAPYDQKFTFHKLTYKVAVDHKFAQHILGYASISRGYKSGTFNTLPLTSDPSNPETVEAYEIGVKSDLFDRRVRLNVAIFQNDIKDPQVETVIATGQINSVGLTNAKKARVKGIEFNADVLVTAGLNVNFGGTYLDDKYRDFRNAPFYFPNPNAPYGNFPVQLGDASGNHLSQVPNWRLTGGVNYTTTASFGELAFNANAAYTSTINWDADNILKQGKYVLLNSSLTYHLPNNDRISLMLFGKNLTSHHYYATELTQGNSGGDIAAPAAPRTYGFEIGYKL